MTSECPRPTIVDFKKMFAKTFKFAPYPEWTETVYSEGDKVDYNSVSYVSLINNNTKDPTDPDGWAALAEYDDTLDVWVAPVAYPTDSIVLWLNTTTWQWGAYKSLIDDNYAMPSDTASWELDTTVNLRSFVMDSDIAEAMREAATVVPDHAPMICDEYKMCFLLMTAHFLITDWMATNQGLNASGTSGILTSRTAGKMSASYAVSPILNQYPQYQAYLTTPWGLKAITTLIRYNVGNMALLQGRFTSY